MIRRLLIANRGEVACRIIRTARRMGIVSVLAASEADAASRATALADAVEVIGPPPASESYLRADLVIEAARRAGCDAVHPGYGFLSESAAFAEAVLAAGLVFVGPTPEAMRRLGGKSAAKTLAASCGVPVVPGYHGDAQDTATLLAESRRIGFPLLVKAVDGGGGRGMRAVARYEDLEASIDSARREALAAFGSEQLLLERLIERPRHVEVQVFGDTHGNVVHMYERDCTLQRRNQKVVEEAPAPGLTQALREKLYQAAVGLARAAKYVNAGTVEFLVEPGRPNARTPFYFIEMNTRLQVEHPVTEAITGLDLVEWQLRVASGEPLPLRQDEIVADGHAVELRLNAEDAAAGFLPSTGRLAACDIAEDPGSLRVETGYRTGDPITPYYDSLIAKIIAIAPTRTEALDHLARVLDLSCNVAGVRTNAALLSGLVAHPDVCAGHMDTGLIGRELAELARSRIGGAEIEAAAEAFLLHEAGRLAQLGPASPWAATDGFALGSPRARPLRLMIDGHTSDFEITWGPSATGPRVHLLAQAPRRGERRDMRIFADGARAFVLFGPDQIEIGWPDYAHADTASEAEPGRVRAPITGRVVKMHVAVGDHVEKGARLAVIEAMKMEHVLLAPSGGKIVRLEAREGAQVSAGTPLVEIADETA